MIVRRNVSDARPAFVALLTALFAALPAAAQTGRIQGEIRNAATQRPIVGAQVHIPGTGIGTTTNQTGAYALPNVPAGQVSVRVQILGYTQGNQTATVSADQTVVLNFELSESAVALDEIVVTGTAGQARSREIGNSVSTINARELELAPVRNTQDVITGRATGVTVLMNSGQPGAGGAIRLRGNKSISQGNNPLIYVDGVRIYSEPSTAGGASRQRSMPLNDIPAEDIERVEIVKGPAATTLYGTEASGGVIQVFTKRGRPGTPLWSVEAGFGFNELDHIGPKDDETGLFLKQCRGPLLVDTNGNAFEDVACPESGTWLRKGMVQRFNASVRGGAGELTYYLSGTFNEEEGAIETGFNKDGGFRGNFSFRPGSRLDFSINTGYTKRKTRWIADGNLANGFTLNVVRGSLNNFKLAGACSTPSITCLNNVEILDQESIAYTDHFVSGLTARWEPNAMLSNRLTVGFDYTRIQNDYEQPFNFSRTPLGSLNVTDQQHQLVSFDYVGTLRNDLLGLQSTLSWGGQLFEDRNRYTSVTGSDFAGPGEPTVTSAARTQVNTDNYLRVVNAGFFIQEMVGWRDRLFITAGLRVDGNSAFGENFGLQPYPKLSAAYVLSDHEFWPEWWEAMKLRFAAGEAGKAPGAFDAVRTWDPIAADDGKPGFTPSQLGNEDLGPERTREYELGFESSAWEARVGLEFTYYYQRVYDALVGVLAPPTLGFAQRQLRNIGTLENKGVELRLDGALLRTDALEWRGRINLSTNHSKALDLDGQNIPVGVRNEVREGHHIPTYFGRRVTNPDAFADAVFEEDQSNGPSYPTRTIGLGTTLNIGSSITFDALAEHQGGHYLANWVAYQGNVRGIWRPCYDVNAKWRDVRSGANPNALDDVRAIDRVKCETERTLMHNDYWIEKADFIKLRYASLTYSLPQNLIPGARTAQLTLAGRNLFTWTDYTGMDPEVADQSDSSFGRRDYYNLPPLRTWIMSMRVTF